jgi:aspartate kinase
VENPKGGGTVIHPEIDSDAPQDFDQLIPEPVTLKNLHELARAAGAQQRKRLLTAMTIKERIIVLNVNSNRKSVSHGFLAGIFGTLDIFGVVVDLISTSEVHVGEKTAGLIDQGAKEKWYCEYIFSLPLSPQ